MKVGDKVFMLQKSFAGFPSDGWEIASLEDLLVEAKRASSSTTMENLIEFLESNDHVPIRLSDYVWSIEKKYLVSEEVYNSPLFKEMQEE